MKITIFISSLSGGGAERVVSNLANHLSRKHQLTILTVANKAPAYYIEDSVDTISLDNKPDANFIVKNYKRVVNIHKFLKKSDQDLFIVFLRVPSFLLLFFKYLVDAPVVVSERADPAKYFDHSKFKTFIMKRLYPKAEGFVFQTNDAKAYYKDVIGNKGIVIPNAINEEFVREPFLGQRQNKIVAAGRFADQKNFPLLIRSFSNISRYFPEYHLELFGDGPDKEQLIKLTNDLGIENKVKFPGYVKDLGEHLSDASLFVLSSNFEGMPNALMEAMALGVPSISTDCPVGGPRFLIQDGENGLLVPVNDEKSLTNAMSEILSNPELAKSLGERSRDITKTLNAEKIYKEWETYLMQIVSANS